MAPGTGNALANLSIDVPGYLILCGYRDPNDDYDTITQADFFAIPEPRAFGLAAIGLLTTILFKFKEEISSKPRYRQGLGVLTWFFSNLEKQIRIYLWLLIVVYLFVSALNQISWLPAA